jgi:3-methylcrotonyl-CoA carboxylase alpha subunit
MVMEAMKMEHSIDAPGDGVVGEVRYRVGELADEGAELLVIAEA